MKYSITGACVSNIGKVRDQNEDNFFFNQNILDENNTGIEDILECTFTNDDNFVFAVFDGMGGEEKGERASFLGVSTLKEYQKSHSIIDWEELVQQANQKVCDEMNPHKRMGSTMAAIQFQKNQVSISNLGDSKIYLLSPSSFGQISEDHIEKTSLPNRKARLMQYLGVYEKEMIIQPFIDTIHYDNVEKIMICSDGITDMISNQEIEEILVQNSKSKDCVEKLLDKALEYGGEDNITVMVFTVQSVENLDQNIMVDGFKKVLNIFNK